MIAVRCFSLAVVEDRHQLRQLNPGLWHETVPDLTHIVIAGELRGKIRARDLPKGITRTWLSPRPRNVKTMDELVMAHRHAMDDAAMAVNLRRPRVMLILNEERADLLAKRLDWFKQPAMMPGTLWNVEPRPKGAIRLRHPESGREYDFAGATYQFLWTDPKLPFFSKPVSRRTMLKRQRREAEAVAKLAAE